MNPVRSACIMEILDPNPCTVLTVTTSNRANRIFYVICIFISIYATGCVSLTPRVQRISDEQNICFDSASISLLQKKYENLKTLKGTALVKIAFKLVPAGSKQGDGRDAAGRAVIIVKRPDQFRLEVLGPFNQTIFLITYNKKNVSLFSFQENKVYRDYPLPADASLFPQYLSGLPAAGAGSRGINNFQQTLPHGRCVYTNSGDEQILINDEGNIEEIILSGAKDDIYPIKVSMDSYKEIDGFNFPFVISLNNKKANILIRYDHIELNQDISDDLFNLPEKREMEYMPPVP